jgi:hypothetical protein
VHLPLRALFDRGSIAKASTERCSACGFALIAATTSDGLVKSRKMKRYAIKNSDLRSWERRSRGFLRERHLTHI